MVTVASVEAVATGAVDQAMQTPGTLTGDPVTEEHTEELVAADMRVLRDRMKKSMENEKGDTRNQLTTEGMEESVIVEAMV
jgi:hypothetical protein